MIDGPEQALALIDLRLAASGALTAITYGRPVSRADLLRRTWSIPAEAAKSYGRAPWNPGHE